MIEEIKNWQGKTIGFRCYECGGIYQNMIGDTCNTCTQKERRHQELLKALRDIAWTKGV